MLKMQKVIFILFFIGPGSISISGFNLQNLWGLDIYDFLDYHGYPHENHEIETEDGYLLSVVRITHGRRSENENRKNFPVFMMHGLLSSAMDWVVLGPNKSLALILADAGYDVWLGNNRGNTLSRKHIKLNPDKDAEFWDFSYNEIGIYDIPAMIDTVLQKTNHEKLIYVGYSQGFTSFTVMGSERPKYIEKIMLVNAFAPVTNMYGVKNPILRILAAVPFIWVLNEKFIHINELFPHTTVLSRTLRLICNQYSVLKYICAEVFIFTGFSKSQLNKNSLSTIVTNFPAGMSTKQIRHYIQGVTSGVFQKYDYGSDEKNIKIYGNPNPPVYNLSRITIPVILYYGEDDYLVNNNVLLNEVAKELPNVVERYLVPYEKFNHLDFIWGQNISLVNDQALKNINKYYMDLYFEERVN